MEKHFESFLKGCMDQGHTQVKLVMCLDANGKVAFYAVGQCGPASSETFEAVVEGKHVRRVVDVPVSVELEVEEFSPEELANGAPPELHSSPEDEAASAE